RAVAGGTNSGVTMRAGIEGAGSSTIRIFFQEEDGIGDWSVTGVQTCALPIWPVRVRSPPVGIRPSSRRLARPLDGRAGERSEERRVGEEGRSRWSPYH